MAIYKKESKESSS